MEAVTIVSAQPVSFLEQPTDYRCDICGTMTTAESFNDIVKHNKLCPCCEAGNTPKEPVPVSKFKRIYDLKKIIETSYECECCGNIHKYTMPDKCSVCDSTTFKRVK